MGTHQKEQEPSGYHSPLLSVQVGQDILQIQGQESQQEVWQGQDWQMREQKRSLGVAEHHHYKGHWKYEPLPEDNRYDVEE